MKFRVISKNFKVSKYNSYSEALSFRNANGGIIYFKIYSQKYGG